MFRNFEMYSECKYHNIKISVYNYSKNNKSIVDYAVVCSKNDKKIYYGYKSTLQSALRLYAQKIEEMVK